MSARRLALVLLSSALVAAGCGSDDEEPAATTATSPQATAKDALPPPSDATEPPPATTSTIPPEAPDDVEPISAPATFRLRGGRLTPPRITVPAFIATEITVANGDGRAHVLVLRAGRGYTLRVAAGGRARLRVPGRPAGVFAITVDGRRRGTLEVGGEPGP